MRIAVGSLTYKEIYFNNNEITRVKGMKKALELYGWQITENHINVDGYDNYLKFERAKKK
jgi:hypothetical protein